MLPALIHERVRLVLREFPEEVRDRLGFAVFELQQGKRLTMPLSRPMPGVGRGVSELRVKDASGQFRVFYVVVSARGVIVFHAFRKKTQATPRVEIELGRKRLKEMLR